jgi:uncharacterized protein (TIGR02594 family)
VKDPEWLAYARKFLDLREIPGSQHNPVILDWLMKLRAWWRDDETPWCGVYVAHCMATFGIPLPQYWMRARDWLNWGTKLEFPTIGCVVVFSRDKGGHVGFVVGRSIDGHLMVLGGNQGNRVSIAPIDNSRVLGYRWPLQKVLAIVTLPIVTSDGKISSNEA